MSESSQFRNAYSHKSVTLSTNWEMGLLTFSFEVTVSEGAGNGRTVSDGGGIVFSSVEGGNGRTVSEGAGKGRTLSDGGGIVFSSVEGGKGRTVSEGAGKGRTVSDGGKGRTVFGEGDKRRTVS